MHTHNILTPWASVGAKKSMHAGHCLSYKAPFGAKNWREYERKFICQLTNLGIISLTLTMKLSISQK